MATVEQQRALALARARKLMAEQQGMQPTGQQQPSGMSFVNRAITGLGAPVDIVAAGLGKLGIETDAPIGGSEWLRRGMESIGAEVAPEGAKATTLGQQIGEGVGQAATMLLPGTLALKALSKGYGVAAGVADQILSTITKAPVTSFAADITSGAASGAGGYIAEKVHPDLKPTGQLVGGFAPTGAAFVSPSRIAAKSIKKTLAPYTREGAEIRAADRLTNLVASPEEAAAKLSEPTLTKLSPAQQIGEPRLLELEKEVLKADAGLDAEFKKRSAQSAAELRSMLNVEGEPQALRGAVESKIDKLTKLIDTRIAQAGDITEQKVSKLSPSMRQSQASIVARDELDKALKAARAEENVVWGDVPNVDVDFSGSRAAYKAIRKATPKAQRDDIPTKARQFLKKDGRLGKKVEGKSTNFDKLKEVQGLRSKLLEEARVARSDGNYNKARIADDIADALLEDMSKSGGGDPLNEAIAFSRELNQKFKQGTVGKLLGTERVGGEKVAPELTLQSSVGAGGVRGEVAMQDLVKAADTPELKWSAEQYLLANLERSAIRDGSLNSSAARRFVKENEELLARFPARRRQILEAADIVDKSKSTIGRLEGVKGRLSNTRKSYAAKFLSLPDDMEFDRLLSGSMKSPQKSIRQLKNTARQDKSGEAMKGLKSGLMGSLIKRSETGVFDENGVSSISGERLLNNLKDKRVRLALKEAFSKEEIERIKRIAVELEKIEVKKTPDVGGIIQDTPNQALQIVARTAGAQVGRKVATATGGGTVQTPGIFAGYAKRLLGKLTNDKAQEILIQAVQDKELMQALLTSTKTKKGAKLANRRLNAWLATPIGESINNMQGEEQ